MSLKRKAKRAGRKRKQGPRFQCGRLKPDPTRGAPTDEVMARRLAVFGDRFAPADPDWVIDRLWARGLLDDRERSAAVRFNALQRGFLFRAGGPRVPGMNFHDARGRGPAPGDESDGQTQDREYRSACAALERLGWRVKDAVLGAACYNHLCEHSPDRVSLVRVGCDALAAHFSRPQHARLESWRGG